MQAILNFFEQLGQFFSDVWDVISMIFTELINFFKTIGSAISFGVSLIKYVPSIYGIFILSLLLILLIYVIVGRTAGGD